ncbi:MAG: pseudouridine synthase [Ginsengibacter sp.]
MEVDVTLNLDKLKMSPEESATDKTSVSLPLDSFRDDNQHRYFVLNKPYNMVSQFVSPHPVNLLGDLDFTFPEGTHAIGRLDNHSEGLLLLTTNKKVTRLLFSGSKAHKRVYLVQINQILSSDNLAVLRTGVKIRIGIDEFYTTPPCEVIVVEDPKSRYAFSNDCADFGPHTWLTITLYEGKYHQVRKMMGAIHHRCKRLIRLSIEGIDIDNLNPGCISELSEEVFFSKLNI